MRRAIAGLVAVLVAGAACSGGEDACSGDADCPYMVTHGGRDYYASCAVVPRRLVGEPLEVSDEQERKFGAEFGVDGFELEGVGAGEAIALRFEQKECGDRAFHVGFEEDVPRDRLREISQQLRL